jgi:hypothetical protein
METFLWLVGWNLLPPIDRHGHCAFEDCSERDARAAAMRQAGACGATARPAGAFRACTVSGMTTLMSQRSRSDRLIEALRSGAPTRRVGLGHTASGRYSSHVPRQCERPLFPGRRDGLGEQVKRGGRAG